MSVNEVMVGVDPIAAAEQRGRDETQPRREFCFTCPSCGNPFVDTVEPSVDIHSGATYKCADCGGSVVFTAETTEQYVKREQAKAKLAGVRALVPDLLAVGLDSRRNNAAFAKLLALLGAAKETA